jgi:hypothetical protein
MRTTPAVRAKIEAAAKRSGRSLAQEVERLIEDALQGEETKYDEFGGRGKYVFMKLLAAAVGVVEHRLGKSFDKDPYVRSQAFLALQKLLEAYFLEEAGEAQAKGQGLLHGDESIGEEIGLELRIQALAYILETHDSRE